MAEVSDDIRAGFIRQRRMLFAASLFLAVSDYLGLSIDQISFLGNSVTPARPERLLQLLWLLWAYAVYRYAVFLHDLGDVGFVDALARNRGNAIRRAIFNQWKKVVRRQLFAVHGPGRLQFQSVQQVSEKLPLQDAEYIHCRASVAYTTLSNASNVTFNEVKESFRIEHRSVLTIRSAVIALIKTILTTRFFTEYALPLLVALLPVAVWAWGKALTS